MPDPLLPGLARVACIGNMPGNAEYVNVFHVQQDGGGAGWLTSTEATSITTAFSAFYNAIKAVLSSSWGMSSIIITDRSVEDGAQFTNPMIHAGALADAQLPNQTAVALTWRTGLSGRRRRGRTYLGGFTEAANDASAGTASRVLAATITTLDTAGANLISALNVSGQPLVVYSRIGTGLATEVVSCDTGNRFDVQRRRRLKGEAYV